ncbi:hypothetical protein Vretimale_9308 [Volvox reticuliferus]|uniref:Uncharacterized protein n=1 Tax=Volvox reticuliferus TaxID=1737510 RepID=A0A8J4FMB4_9CHLO|nr:hypothetical protein Vretifemale_10124 [Volvox reticuliferus]GIM04803.1 hypothetical protein Vretimale_9308 [Volvox reticuliferus]
MLCSQASATSDMMMSRRPCDKFLGDDDTMDFSAGNDSRMLRTGSDGNTGGHVISSQEMLLMISRLSDDGVQQPDKALGVSHRLGLADSNAATGSFGVLTVDRNTSHNPDPLCRSPEGPKAGSIGDVHQEDCGSVRLTGLSTFGDTSSSFMTSMSSCGSQNDLADFSQAAHPGLTGRLSLVPFESPFIPLGSDNDYLRSEAFFDEGRHHGGDDAATALRSESARLSHASQASKPVNCITASQSVPNPLRDKSLFVHGKPNDPGLSHSGGSQELRVHACAARLLEATAAVDANTVAELFTATITPGRWQYSSWVASEGLQSTLPDDGGPFGGATISLQKKQRPFSGGILSAAMYQADAEPCDPSCWVKSAAGACATMTSSGSPSGVQRAMMIASGVASDPVSTPSAPQSMPQCCRAAVLHSNGAAATEASMEMSPFAVRAYDGSLVLDHELPDDSVHGGRPRHPSSMLAAQPCDSLLLAWAETEAVTKGMHLMEPAESGTIAVSNSTGSTPSSLSAILDDFVIAGGSLVAPHRCRRPRLREPQLQLKILRTTPTWKLLQCGPGVTPH